VNDEWGDGSLVGLVGNELGLLRLVKVVEAALVAVGLGQRHLEQTHFIFFVETLLMSYFKLYFMSNLNLKFQSIFKESQRHVLPPFNSITILTFLL
jgi:hypothetical protein